MSRKIRYLAAGAWNTLFGYGVFIILCRAAAVFGVHYLYALTVSHVLATTNAYLSYKHFVFKTKSGWLREYFRFSLVYWVIFVANFFALPALVRVTGFGPIAAQGVITAVTAAASYLAHSRFSFQA